MTDTTAPYHAHIYYALADRDVALALQERLKGMMQADAVPLFVGALKDRKAGPHPIPQFEIHFLARDLPVLTPILEGSGLRTLVHPLTDDDMADHTVLGNWIGAPIDLDLTTLDPPGVNQGIPRFGKTDF